MNLLRLESDRTSSSAEIESGKDCPVDFLLKRTAKAVNAPHVPQVVRASAADSLLIGIEAVDRRGVASCAIAERLVGRHSCIALEVAREVEQQRAQECHHRDDAAAATHER